MRNASMKVLKNLVCCAAFICLMFVLAMPAHAASKADELLQLVNAERAQAGVAPLSMGSSALNAAAQARAKGLTVNYSYNRPNGSREFTILPEYGVDDVSVGENYWAAAENASDVVAAWNRYDFFKERMLDKDATSVGIGYYEGGEYGNYWVMIFTYARGTSENGFAQEVLALVNAERAKEVAKVASHTRPDGTNCFTVLKEYGVSDTATGENAAWGETTPEKVVADWMASEGHRVNIMDPAAKYMCLGYNYDANSQWGHNWIQIFAK
uniref:CAP domain-containing protein n=1 Tax=Faecalibacterium sp. TaxID=1971605 RepID=UPI004025EE83